MSLSIRQRAKSVANLLARLATWPAAACCHLVLRWQPESEKAFLFWANAFSLLPGDPGVYLRRAFYCQTLQQCSERCFIGFGAMFTHQQAVVEDDVYIGVYALLGVVRLRRGCLIGSRASLLSGGELHEFDAQGNLKPYDPRRLRRIEIGEQAWIGEGAILMAHVGSRAIVAAGSVIASDVPPAVVMAGNPARFVRHVEVGEPAPHTLAHSAGTPASAPSHPTAAR